MAVIINDFEVLVEPPAAPQQAGAGAAAPAPAPRLRPEEIERIVRHFERRRARLRAD
jgi:hypothetical protein